MSQSEKKSKGSSLIMPLAIGGGLLILFMGMKKAKAQGEGSLPALPELDTNQAAPQIVPEAAPKYTDVVENDDDDDDATNTTNYSPIPSSNSGPNYNTLPSNSPEEEEEESNNSGGYQDNNYIPKSNSATKWNERKDNKIIGNGKPKLGTRAQSDQDRKFADRTGIVNSKVAKINAMRSQSEQAKLAQQKASNKKPVFSPIPFIAKTQKAIAQKNAAAKIFPLKQGQTNNYIKEVQRKLGVSNTGFFGTLTRAALVKKYKVSEVSEALYKQIMTGKSVMAKPIIPLKKMTPLKKKPIKILPKRKIVAKKR